MEKKIISILGPTASGKTKLATHLAAKLKGEIISADSRQVYKGMDIGTGKDLNEYRVGDKFIAYHLIDILPAGEKYNLAQFQNDFREAVSKIGDKPVILCGGTGLYIQSVIEGFEFTSIPENSSLREQLNGLPKQELDEILGDNSKDYSTIKRKIRAIEIKQFLENNPDFRLEEQSHYDFKVFGLNPSLEVRRKRISERLKFRLENLNMIGEVEILLNTGVAYEILQYYGLEYKYVSKYLLKELSYDEMFKKLETEIHRYAKRQMTFFRSMEKKGIEINWIPESLTLEQRVSYIKQAL